MLNLQYERLTLESWYTNLEQTPLKRCQQEPITGSWCQPPWPAPYKRLTKPTNGLNSSNSSPTDRPMTDDELNTLLVHSKLSASLLCLKSGLRTFPRTLFVIYSDAIYSVAYWIRSVNHYHRHTVWSSFQNNCESELIWIQRPNKNFAYFPEDANPNMKSKW